MPKLSNLKDIESYLRQKIDEVLSDEVSKEVVKTESQQVKTVVYGNKEPSVYQRRKDNGGLSDIRNMVSIVKDGILEVKNITEVNPIKKSDGSYFNNAFPTDYGLAEIVEYGNKNGIIANPKRPFTQATKDDLEESKKHIEALKRGLKKRGVNSK